MRSRGDRLFIAFVVIIVLISCALTAASLVMAFNLQRLVLDLQKELDQRTIVRAVPMLEQHEVSRYTSFMGDGYPR